ncbi:tRNA(Ile2) 2-agmatinylcytidine synthetase TiaS [Natronomonas moolapensis 8.8.11]|uniref:tRNA(Ile2) 2-agmatinylcytidine synthetase TiaS n=1 Tax=Natronomonas moolapensis (strain DSM 18674 / CECT 7526 / JCM 14361 / 8.8.11) TaxID=268739 RepID=M1XSQ7_NATM8|nr:tRNA(Ile)(2)-agmatinylcytidine synthase [Natronomonas moolapensis]CCQ37387.1 tRNA(Ile2) 2-agmatinylcytidine synthetase TiaS [Natronomonas moolapensis 8.8.11]
MTVLGIDDTDSRERGMCTTYVADTVARRLERRGATIDRVLLIRCNPAVEHKTRGNAALAVHTNASVETAFETAHSAVEEAAEIGDDRTNPGVVVAPGAPDRVPEAIAGFARDAVEDHLTREAARRLADRAGYRRHGWKNGRGVIGALAAVGAWRALEEWTYERIAYREPSRWGTDRVVDPDSVFEAADAHYPTVWDTVDRATGEVVCVPRTPGPILYGVRGDDPAACRAVATGIESEPPDRARTFRANQGTDGHLRDGTIEGVRDGYAYRLDGRVLDAPETRRGGHVFVSLGDDRGTIDCVAFEPTKRFRDRVRALRVGDRITVCGEVSNGTVKLEKFAARELVRTELATPTCPKCDRTMESAGSGQGYRCRDCGTSEAGKVEQPIERGLETGWYEVPPRARRHIAKPLVRGGFDGAVHPER